MAGEVGFNSKQNREEDDYKYWRDTHKLRSYLAIVGNSRFEWISAFHFYFNIMFMEARLSVSGI